MLDTLKSNRFLFQEAKWPDDIDQGEKPEQAKVPSQMEAIRDAITQRDKISADQKNQIDQFLKSISTPDGKIKANLTDFEKQELAFLKSILLPQEQANQDIDTNFIRARYDIKQTTQRALTQARTEVSESQNDFRALKRWDKSQSVKLLQKALGMSETDITAWEGSFWPKTEALLRKYQQDNWLKVDGIAGRETLSKLWILTQLNTSDRGAPIKPNIPPKNPESAPVPLASVRSQRQRPERGAKLTTPQKRALWVSPQNPLSIRPTNLNQRNYSTTNIDSSELAGKKWFFESLFRSSDDIDTSKFNSLRTQIESKLSAKSWLDALEREIFAISNTTDIQQIERVYNQALQAIASKGINLPIDIAPIEKAYILQFLANALMGGKKMVDRRENPKTSVKEFIQADRSQALEADKLFKQHFSGTMVHDIGAARNLAYKQMEKIWKYEQIFLDNEAWSYLFSARSKAGINGLQGFSTGTSDMVNIGVPYVRITEFEKKDVLSLINKLNPVQLTLLRQQLRPTFGKLNDVKIKELLASGERQWKQFIVSTPQWKIEIELTFNKSANCFNDTVGFNLNLPSTIPYSPYINTDSRWGDGWSHSWTWWFGSTPWENSTWSVGTGWVWWPGQSGSSSVWW
jgi:hypothetical protein